MLSLLWTRLDRKFIFWSKLVALCFVLHLFALSLIFFVYSGQKTTFNVSINRSILNSGAPIIFMSASKKASIKNAKKYIKKCVKRNNKKNISQAKTKSSIIKKSVTKKVIKKKIVQKKIVKKPVKLVAKKVEKKIKKVAKKKIASKKIAKKPVKPVAKKVKKKIKKVEKKPVIKKEIKKVIKKKINKEENILAKNIELPDEKAIYIGQHELQALKIQYEIESQVTKYWAPPLGFSKDLVCVIWVLIGWDGKVQKSKVIKSSGICTYDITARATLSKLCLSSCKGKEVNITFNQS